MDAQSLVVPHILMLPPDAARKQTGELRVWTGIFVPTWLTIGHWFR